MAVQVVGAAHTSHLFPGLTPGRLYRSEVVTLSGELTNRVSAMGRTGETEPDLSRGSRVPDLISLLCSTRSSGTAHPPVRQTRCDQRRHRAGLVRPRPRRLRLLPSPVGPPRPSDSHADPPDRAHPGRDVSGAALQLHRGDREWGRGQRRTSGHQPANPEERQDK